jgi:hypothetical protein
MKCSCAVISAIGYRLSAIGFRCRLSVGAAMFLAESRKPRAESIQR